MLLSPCEGPKDECDGNFPLDHVKRRAQSVADPNRADHDLLERFEHRRTGIGLKEAVPVAAEDSALGEKPQLPLDGPRPAPGPTDDLTQVKRLVGPQKHQRKYRPARFSEQNVSGVSGRNHIEYNRTNFGCTLTQTSFPLTSAS